MEMTEEQKNIINSSGNIKINAVAGSGKTTTIIEYAAARPKDSRILYLAFNRSVKIEASKKFEEKKLYNVRVETAHSLSYRHIVPGSVYKVKAQGYSTNELVDILKLRSSGEKHSELITANHIKKFITYFCNSDAQKVQMLNYLDTVSDNIARSFVSKYYSYIESGTRSLLNMMDKGEIEIIHDFYLKKFQLSQPKLDFDYILFDEGQDASQAMLDVFFKQDAVKVIVGDTHQQIYSWRFAVNSLEKADYKTFLLSKSFRFGNDIANLASEIINLKKHIKELDKPLIAGTGTNSKLKSKAILARSNIGLLQKAIDYVMERKKISGIYFEGNFNSYTYADEGASLYDILNLYNERHEYIRDKIIKSMKSIKELEKYVKETDDVQLGMMVDIVKKYGNKIPSIIKTIKEKHLNDNEKEKAEMIFSTVHRCKGMEYDEVYLANDFINEEKLEKSVDDKSTDELTKTKLNEEINLLYVAVTRTKNMLHIPDSLMPKNSKTSSRIKLTPAFSFKKNFNDWEPPVKYYREISDTRKYSFYKARQSNKEAYKPWTELMDKELIKLYSDGKSVVELAGHFERTDRAIESRLRKLILE